MLKIFSESRSIKWYYLRIHAIPQTVFNWKNITFPRKWWVWNSLLYIRKFHENPSKCDVQLFSQNTKLSISPQECKIFLTKYIFSKSTLLKLQNPVFGFFIRPMVHFLRELNLEVKFSGIEYLRDILENSITYVPTSWGSMLFFLEKASVLSKTLRMKMT